VGTSNVKISSAAYPFEVPRQHLPFALQELQMGGAGLRHACGIFALGFKAFRE
jgi:hypothetical protein